MAYDDKGRLLTVLLLVVILMLAVGALMMFVFGRIVFALSVPSPGEITTGRVISYTPGYSTSKYSRTPGECLVSYNVEGKTYYKNGASCGGADVGEDVDVLYQTTDPGNSVLDTRANINWIGIVALLLGIAAYFIIRKLKKESGGSNIPPDSETPVSILN